MHIVGIQFRRNEQSVAQEQACIQRELGDGVTTTFYNAVDGTVAWDTPSALLAGADGVVLGGSGEFDFDGNRADDDEGKTMSAVFRARLKPFFDYVFAHDVPTLGICYGHQIIADYAGVTVWADPEQKKTKSNEVTLVPEYQTHPLFAGISGTFMAQYGHKDSLDALPEGARLVAHGGDGCKFSMLHYQNHIFTCQFHPELTNADLKSRIAESPGYLPEGVSAEEIFCDTPESSKILQNFPAFIKSTQA